KPGFLPRGFNPTTSTYSSSMVSASYANAATRSTSLLGSISTGVGTVASRIIPIAGAALMLYSIYSIGKQSLQEYRSERLQRLNAEREQNLKNKEFIDKWNQNLNHFWGGNASLREAGE